MPYGSCQRCGWQYDLSDIRKEWSGLRVCPPCFDPRPVQLSPPRIRPEGLPLLNAAPEGTGVEYGNLFDDVIFDPEPFDAGIGVTEGDL